MSSFQKMPLSSLPREKLIQKGSVNLKDKELLAILLRTGRAGKNVIEVADYILKKFPQKSLFDLKYEELVRVKGISQAKACTLLAAFELAKRVMEVKDDSLPYVNSAQEAVLQLMNIRNNKRECFVTLYLNARNQLVYKEIISMGILNSNLVHPREVFEPAIRHLCAGIIVGHNHPSGDPTPSLSDLKITQRLIRAGNLLGIDLIDHLIVSKNDYFSLRDKGAVDFN